MFKIYLSLIVVFVLSFSSAKANILRDSVGVENVNGKKVIIHQVKAKDTYYAIGRRYNVPPKDIMTYNSNKFLQVGILIKVPTNIPFDETTTATTTVQATNTSKNITIPPPVDGEYISHTVKKGDNLSSIAQQYGTSVGEIKSLNNLTRNSLSSGQVLRIKASKPSTTPSENNTTSTANNTNTAATTNSTTESNATTMVEHIVAGKDNLYSLARKYGTTVNEIKKANNLSSSLLRDGTKLMIPATKNVDQANQTTASQPDAKTETPTQAPAKNQDTESVAKTSESTAKPSDGGATHTVLRNETIFTIAKLYNTTAYQIRKLNNLPDNNISIGQALKVPGGVATEVMVPKEKQAETTAMPKPATAVQPTANQDNIIHTVEDGETIYTIAKKYNVTAYQIRVANKMEDNNIKSAQKLIIPKTPQTKYVNDTANIDKEADSTSIKDPKLRRDPSVYGLSQIEEKGAGVWISDADLDGTKMLVLHRTAPVGRVIKITNPMTNKTTFAKVVGKFTENESTKDVIIVMTKAVADSLGAIDKRFLCNITYSAQ